MYNDEEMHATHFYLTIPKPLEIVDIMTVLTLLFLH